jgi:Domain of unknown function (DUF1905)
MPGVRFSQRIEIRTPSGKPLRAQYLSMKFRTRVELGGKTATGLSVPADIVAKLGTSKRPAVQVTIGGHSYQTTVASMGGRFLVPLSAQNRAAAGVSAGDEVEVEIASDDAPREVDVPEDLAAALEPDEKARSSMGFPIPTARSGCVGSRTPRRPTHAKGIDKAAAALRAGQRTR